MPLPEWPYTPATKEYDSANRTVTVIKPTYGDNNYEKPNNLITVLAANREVLELATDSRWDTNNSPDRVVSKNSGSRINSFTITRPLTFYREIE